MFKNKETMVTDGNGESSMNVAGHTFHEEGNAKPFHKRTLSLNFPRFDGEDPEGWCSRVSKFFDSYNTPDQARFKIIGVKLWFGFKHYALVTVFLLGMNFSELFKHDFRQSVRNNKKRPEHHI